MQMKVMRRNRSLIAVLLPASKKNIGTECKNYFAVLRFVKNHAAPKAAMIAISAIHHQLFDAAENCNGSAFPISIILAQ